MRHFESWLGNNIDWLVGTVVGFIGIVVALLIYSWERNSKQLDYEVVRVLPLLSQHGQEMRGKLQLLYEGTAVVDPHRVSVKILNTGKTAVTAGDYVQDIILEVENPTAAAIDVFVADESSIGVAPAIELTGGMSPHSHRPIMQPALLNTGDWFEVQLITSGNPGKITMHSRFRDQSKPMRDMRDVRLNSFRNRVGRWWPVKLAPLAIIALSFYSLKNDHGVSPPILVALGFLLGLTIFFADHAQKSDAE